MDRLLILESIRTAGRQLNVRYSYDKYRFSTSFWYEFDLQSLEELYGAPFMENVYFTCAAFDMIKFVSLKPTSIDFGSYSRLVTGEFERVWRTIVANLSSQWRYENNVPVLKQPQFSTTSADYLDPVEIKAEEGSCSTLAFSGGGKDSLVVQELLSKADMPFSTCTCSSSMYGEAAIQFERDRKLLQLLGPDSHHHRVCIIDEFPSSPILESLGEQLGIKSTFSALTPTFILAALPVMLHYKYTNGVIGNERSANVGNLVWEETGEEINHQWDKSREFDVLMHNYIKKALVRNVSYFSLLQSIHDIVIMEIAASRPDAIVHTHSCNIAPPWCLRCPKCCYVWLALMSYLPRSIADKMFGNQNPLELPENQQTFAELTGLGAMKPFEAIGEIDEMKLVFECCRRKGLTGKAMENYKEKVLPSMGRSALAAIIAKYTTVYPMDPAVVPALFIERVSPLLEQYGESIRKKLTEKLLSN